MLGRAAALRLLGRENEALPPILRAAERRLRRGDENGAAELLQRAVEILSPDPDLLASLGEARLRARQFLSAETVLRQAAAQRPTESRVLHLLAAAEWENGKLEAAELTYRKLLGSDPGDAEAWFQLGRLLGWSGRYREALDCFELAAQRGYDGPDLPIERGRALDGASGDPGPVVEAREIVGAYTAAVAAAPADYQARFGLARALKLAGDHEAAERELNEFRRLYAEHQDRTRRAGLEQARLDLARERLRAGSPDEALAALEGAAGTADSHHLRALAHLARGDDRTAREELETAISIAPERTDLRVLLSRLRSQLRQR